MQNNKMALHAALQLVQADARERSQIALTAMQEEPLDGWSVMQHMEYHQKDFDEAEATRHYCFNRMMQISPD